MRRSVSYYESRIDLTEEQQAEIRKRLGDSADTFIETARLAGGEYRSKAAAWSGPTPAEVRRTGAEEQIRNGQAVDQQIKARATDASGEPLHPDLALSTETDLDDLRIHLRRIAAACVRAARSSALNQGRGKEPDYARLTLIRELGVAYKVATGEEPAQRSDGHFAGIARIVLEAAGADPGISNDTLKKLFGTVR